MDSLPVEHTTCPLCHNAPAELLLTGFDRLHGLPGTFGIVQCSRCQLMRTDPRPVPGAMHHYYPSDYGPHQARPPRRRRALQRINSGALSSLATAVPPLQPGRMLEVGCGSGGHLADMANQGWQVVGIEPSAVAAQRARDVSGAHVLNQSVDTAVDNAELLPGSFQLICAWMVLEHLYNPVATLRRLAGLLSEGGCVALSVPDAGAWEFRRFGNYWLGMELPRHLFHFTRQTLTRVLEDAGLSPMKVQHQRTSWDALASLAYVMEDRYPARARTFRRVVHSVPIRAVGRAVGLLAGPLGKTSRLTVWARKAPGA